MDPGREWIQRVYRASGCKEERGCIGRQAARKSEGVVSTSVLLCVRDGATPER